MKLRREDLHNLIESYLLEQEEKESDSLDSEPEEQQEIEKIEKEFTVPTSKGTHIFKISIDEEGVVVDKTIEGSGGTENILKLTEDDLTDEAGLKIKNHLLSNIIAGIGKSVTRINDKDEKKEKLADSQAVIDAVKNALGDLSLSDSTFRTHFVNFESEFGHLETMLT